MKNFLFLGLAVIAATVFSCSSQGDLLDEVTSDSWYTTPLESDQTFYANIAVSGMGTGTRAGDMGEYGDPGYDSNDEPNFDEGGSNSNKENNVKTIFFVFYDKNGNRVSTTQVRQENADRNKSPENSEYEIYSGVVQIDIKHGSLRPAYVMAFINPITSTNFEINPEFETLKSLQDVKRPRIIDDHDNFAMSKSVYYGVDEVSGSPDKVKILTTPIPEGKLFKSVGEAEAALAKPEGEDIIDIYVERYAVKVSFDCPQKTYEIKIGDDKLNFIPEYWAVNAYESETYAVKSFLNSEDETFKYEDLSKALNWYWNSEKNHRSYWAQSPAYYAEKYPRVADDIIDNGDWDDVENKWTNNEYILGYYSYNNMAAEAATSKLISKARKVYDTNEEYGKIIYARENTVSGSALRTAYENPSASPKAAIASIVMVGHYTLNESEVGENNSFYVMGNATNGYSLYKNDDEMMNYFVNTTIRFAKDNRGQRQFFNYALEGGSFNEEDEDNYKKYFIIEHPSKATREDLVVDSRFVTIQLNKDEVLNSDNSYPLYAYLDGAYKLVTAENIDEVNQKMFYAAGTAQGYKGGKTYFTIPIKHLGFYRSDNTDNKDKNANDKDFKWLSVKSGDFGLVRNHSYSIEVESIEGLGNGIPNPDDPIVPPTDPEEYFIGARLIVLNWAIVPKQKVKL